MSQAGAVLLWETMRVTGLGRGLSDGLARWRAPRAVHDPGKIVADRAAAVALGGDCLADIAVLREQPELAGPVASDPVVSRLVRDLAAQGPRALRAIRGARTAPGSERGRWPGKRPGAAGGLVTVDLDATAVRLPLVDGVGQVGHPPRRPRADRLQGHAARVHALEQADSGAEQHG